jgi:hypothetical protein
MPWQPQFWIKKKDFATVKEKYSGQYGAWEFEIAGNKGAILVGSTNRSQPNAALHAFFCGADIDHWVVNGEGKACDDCHTYGKFYEGGYN